MREEGPGSAVPLGEQVLPCALVSQLGKGGQALTVLGSVLTTFPPSHSCALGSQEFVILKTCEELPIKLSNVYNDRVLFNAKL